MTDRPRPAAVADAESQPYWDAVRDGRLLVQRCTNGHQQLYPRPHCIVCRAAVDWVDAVGRGAVYSFTVIHQNFARPWRDMVPYVVALVDLEEGPRLMTNIEGCDPSDVRIGAAVRFRPEPAGDDGAVPVFEPG